MADRSFQSTEAAEPLPAALRELTQQVPGEARRRLLEEIDLFAGQLRRRERERCVAICRGRAELWRNTTAARSSVAAAREEARARANEAHYIADLLASGEDLSGVGGGGDGDA